MSEPDSPNDKVFYEPVNWHFTKALSIVGENQNISINGYPFGMDTFFLPVDQPSGSYIPTNKGASAPSAITAINVAVFCGFDLSKALPISAVVSEVTGLVAGSTYRLAMYADNGLKTKPLGAPLWDSGEISGAVAAVNETPAVLTLPVGRIWYGWVAHVGTPTMRAFNTAPFITSGRNVASSSMISVFPLLSGVVVDGAFPTLTPASLFVNSPSFMAALALKVA